MTDFRGATVGSRGRRNDPRAAHPEILTQKRGGAFFAPLAKSAGTVP